MRKPTDFTQNILRTRYGKRHCLATNSSKEWVETTLILKFCIVCSKLYLHWRIDKMCCSHGCTKRLCYLKKKGINALVDKSKIAKPTRKELIKFGFIKETRESTDQE